MARRKRLNKNLVIALTGLGFIMTTAAGVLMVYLLQDSSPDRFVELAEQAVEKKEWGVAEQYYRRAYSVSDDPKYLVQAGDMHYAAGEEPAAMRFWLKAVEIDPVLRDGHERLLDLRLDYSRFNRGPNMWLSIRETATAILDIPPKSAKALYALGTALIELETLGQTEGDEEKGLEYLKEAVGIAPEVVDYSQRLAEHYFTKEQFDLADATYTSLIKMDSQVGQAAAEARSAYASFLLLRNDSDRALEFYREAIEMAGDDAEAKADVFAAQARYWAGEWLRSRGSSTPEGNTAALAKATQLCEQAIEAYPQCFQPYLILADLYRADEKTEEAAKVCDARTELPIVRKGSKRFEQKHYQYLILIKAAEMYNSLAFRAATPAERAEYVLQANKRLSDAEDEMPQRPRTLETKSVTCIAQGKTKEALQLGEQADVAYGDRVRWQNKQRLALLYQDQGELGSARRAIEGAIRLPGAPASCWATYGRILLELDDAFGAAQATERALQLAPDHIGAMETLAQAYTALGRPDQAKATLDRIEQAGGAAVQARVRFLVELGKSDEAIDLLLRKIEEYPRNAQYAMMAAALLDQADRNEEALAVIQKAIELYPNHARLKAILAQLDRTKTSEERQTADLQRIAETKDAFTRESQYAYYYASRREAEEAEKHFKEADRLFVEKATPGAQAATLDMLRQMTERRLILAISTKNWSLAEGIAADAIERNLDNADGLTFLGRVRLAQEKHEEAMRAFNGALEKQPTNSKTLTLLGECYLALKRFPEARGVFERATDINPRDGLAWKGRALLAMRDSEDEEFREAVLECQKNIPTDPWVREQITVLREKDNPTEGIARREEIRAQNPEGVQNLLRLAELYDVNGEHEKAEERYLEALKVQPDATGVVWAVAKHYRTTGELDEGLRLIQDLVQSIEDTDTKAAAQLLVGAYFEELGGRGKADAAYLAAADIKASESVNTAIGRYFARTDRNKLAIDWFGKALRAAEAPGSPPSPQAARIRRMEIECHLQLRQKDVAQAKLAEYFRKHTAEADELQGLLLQAELEAIQGRIGDATETLSRYLEKQPANTDNLLRAIYRQAQHFAALGRWQAACKNLEQLRTMAPKALEYRPRVLLARGYSQTGRDALAETELRNVLAEDPAAQSVVYELIRLYQNSDRLIEAERIVTGLLSREPDNATWLYTAGRIALELKDTSKCLKMLRGACEHSDFQPMLVTKFLEACIEREETEAGIRFYEHVLPSNRRHPNAIVKYAHLLAMRAAALRKSGDADSSAKQEAAAVKNYLLSVDVAGLDALNFIKSTAEDATAALGGTAAVDFFRIEPADARLRRPAKHLLAVLLGGHNKYDEAGGVIEGLLETTEDDAEQASLLILQGMLAGEQQDFSTARLRYEEALKFGGDNVTALNNLAYLLATELNMPQQALPYAERVRFLDSSPPVLDTVGWVYVQLGQYRDAIAELTRAVQSRPDYSPALVHLGEAHRLDKNFADAEHILQSALNQIDPTGEYAEFRPEAEASLRKVRDRQSEP